MGRFAYFRNLDWLRVIAAFIAAVSVIQFAAGNTIATSHTAPAASQHGAAGTEWHTDFASATTAARQSGKILMVDLFAEWCAACKELAAITFPHPTVAAKLEEFTLAQLDFTTIEDPQQQIMDRYSIVGLPAILFLDAQGNEYPDSRITGFVGPAEFVAHLDKVQSAAKPK